MSLSIRTAVPADAAAIHALVAAAFAQADEANLVEVLRRAGDLAIELVAEEAGTLVGHIAFQPLGLAGEDAASFASLAPVSVAPHAQRRGVGTTLVRAGLRRLQHDGCDQVFVLGDTDYYGRFGFKTALAVPYRAPWSGDHFQALRLSDRPIPRGGDLVYPAAFSGG